MDIWHTSLSDIRSCKIRILIAPDKFKGSLGARRAGRALARGLQKSFPAAHITTLPLADGGEGSLEVLQRPLGLKRVECRVRDPLFRPRSAVYGYAGGRAYIEMAAASGLQLLSPEERDPLQTSSYGTGELIADALRRGAREIYIFAGGSATTDAGLGMAAALGFRFMDSRGRELPPLGSSLEKLEQILPPHGNFTRGARFFLLADVDNPLYGEEGAARVYAAQKGADAAGVERLDEGLRCFARVAEKMGGAKIASVPGSGAAGGLGAGALFFLDAEIGGALRAILEWLHFEAHLRQSDLVVSGEGRLDGQTLRGKVVSGVARLCRRHGKTLALVCGQSLLTPAQIRGQLGVRALRLLMDGKTDAREAMADAARLAEQRAFELGEMLKKER